MRFWPVFGGGETVTRTLVNEMSKRKYDITVIYLWDRTNNTNVFIDEKVKAIKIDGVTNVNDGGIKKSEYKQLSEKLKGCFENIKPDIVINQWFPSEIVKRAAKGQALKIVKCHHGVIKYVPHITTLKQKLFYTIFGDKAGWLRIYPELRRDYLYSDIWVLLSEASRKDAEYLLPWAKKERIKVISNPISYTENLNTIKLEEKKKEVIYVGRVIELKRVGYLLEAWKKIEDKVPDWTFKIIGDGVNLEAEKNHAKELEVSHVFFEGFQDSKPYMLEASILLMASSQEGFSMVLVEAQQCGCVPIVVDSFPTVHDIIENDKNGILVENNNIMLYAEALLNLINDKEKRRRLAFQGMKDSKKFSASYICDQWENLFRSLKGKGENEN